VTVCTPVLSLYKNQKHDAQVIYVIESLWRKKGTCPPQMNGWLNACPSLVGLIVLSLQGRLSYCEVEVLEGFAK